MCSGSGLGVGSYGGRLCASVCVFGTHFSKHYLCLVFAQDVIHKISTVKVLPEKKFFLNFGEGHFMLLQLHS